MTINKATIRKEDKRIKLQRFANYMHRTREGMDFVLLIGDKDGFGAVTSITDERVAADVLLKAARGMSSGKAILGNNNDAMRVARRQAAERFR